MKELMLPDYIITSLHFHCFVCFHFMTSLKLNSPTKPRGNVTFRVDQSNCVCKTFCTGVPELISISLSRARMHSSALCFTWEWWRRRSEIRRKKSTHRIQFSFKSQSFKYLSQHNEVQQYFKTLQTTRWKMQKKLIKGGGGGNKDVVVSRSVSVSEWKVNSLCNPACANSQTTLYERGMTSPPLLLYTQRSVRL